MRSGLVSLTLLSLVLAPLATNAQETTGRLEGRVLNPQGQPVAEAAVMVASPSLQGTRAVLTSQDGTFALLALPIGTYGVRIAHAAFQAQLIRDVRVRLAQTTSLGDVRLQEKVYAMEEVSVVGKPTLIDPTSTEMGATLTTRDYEALPLARDYRSVATLLPQTTESYLGDPMNFAGATGMENRYFIDGIDVSDSFKAREGTGLPYNFVQEVEVRTGGYEAEYRSSLGGTINAVTYSGSNKVTGQVFGFFTNNWFTGTPRSLPDARRKGDFAVYDVGIGLGGPIAKDRLWYYAAYNPTRRQEDYEVPGWGFLKDWTTTHNFAGKLTWRANAGNTLTLSAVGDPSEARSVWGASVPPLNLDPLLYTSRNGNLNFMLSGRHLVHDHLLIETSLSRSTRQDRYFGETERGQTELSFTDSTGAASGGANDDVDERSTVTLAAVSGTWTAGRHEVKAGLEYKDAKLKMNTYYEGLVQNSATSYHKWALAFLGEVSNRIPSAYVEDSWRLIPAVRINGGVRWDGQNLVSSEGKVVQKILDQWQPRVGATYQPGGNATHKVFGSFGRYYQELTTAPAAFWYSSSSYYEVRWDHDPRVDPSGGDSSQFTGSIQNTVPGMKGQYFDEFTLGYERQIGEKGHAGLRGVYRTLRQGLEDGLDTLTGTYWFGNPGSGHLSAFPKMKRNYSALEASYRQEAGERLTLLGSYVLSRNYGNYEGLFDSQGYNPYVNATSLYDAPWMLINAEGLLPNDRTHVLKLSGSYRLGWGVTLGAYGSWASGTPMSERVGWDYLRRRGSAGRTPSIWDLNLRVSYQAPFVPAGQLRPKLTVDFLHVASQRTPVNYDWQHYFGTDDQGNPINPNPRYGLPTGWQPPMAVRVGAEVGF